MVQSISNALFVYFLYTIWCSRLNKAESSELLTKIIYWLDRSQTVLFAHELFFLTTLDFGQLKFACLMPFSEMVAVCQNPFPESNPNSLLLVKTTVASMPQLTADRAHLSQFTPIKQNMAKPLLYFHISFYHKTFNKEKFISFADLTLFHNNS